MNALRKMGDKHLQTYWFQLYNERLQMNNDINWVDSNVQSKLDALEIVEPLKEFTKINKKIKKEDCK
ncbi:10914_t:CDS:2 [Cetraspora pellucida]|uniref:10914_t:CDS:1 n=1 Tax=Cetraspora pellucida TaxID=1433469 RepID=A0A9N9E2K7_9GLOM|nr:10914_t:CDS:2 [Cetraspora pellucida]